MEKETIDLVDEQEESIQNNTNSSLLGKKRKRESCIWDSFEKKFDSSTKALRANCRTCPKNYAIGDGTTSHGTRNLHAHNKICPGLVSKDVNQMLVDHEGKLRFKKICQEIYRQKMAKAIMMHNYPFLIVEHNGLRSVHSYLNSDVKPYTRNTAKADCIKIYKLQKENLKSAFVNILGRICLTSDVWTSGTSEGYICLTAHFVDHDSVLHSRIINFCHFPPPHTGMALAQKVFEFLKDWGIEKKIYSLSLDNASNNDNMQTYWKAHLRGHLLCNGEFFHIRCSAHILNLIVQDGLRIASVALSKIRECVKFIKGSEGRKRKFVSCCEQLHLSVASGLKLDCVTRWNSTYNMLACALRYRDAFLQYSMVESAFVTCPSHDEWEVAIAIFIFLKAFWVITNLFSGSNYPTANLYFGSVFKIHQLLQDSTYSNIEPIRDMVNVLKPKFAKYWEDYTIILSMATILDPRYKVQYVKFCLEKVEYNDSEVSKKVERIVNAMKKLFDEYKKNDFQESQGGGQASEVGYIITTTTIEESDDEIDEFERVNHASFSTRSELEQYLEEKRLPAKTNKDLDVLKEWKKLAERYPILSKMARDILTIPITTVASKSAFSIGAKALTKYRNSLLSENAQALVCGRNWLCGYDIQGDEPTDKQLTVSLVENPESKGSNDANTSCLLSER